MGTYLLNKLTIFSAEFGPFTETAELYNGRTAMLGFVGILGIEFYSHTAILG